MRTTIDRAGRIVVPKVLRERAGLVPGAEVDIAERDGKIEIAPSSTERTIVDSPNGPIVRGEPGHPPLDPETVRATLEATRT